MDILDPLDCSSNEGDVSDTKVILNDGISIHCKNNIESDDEQNVVDHLSPQTLLETPNDNDVQYSLRSPEGLITYRVLQVDESGVEAVPQIVSTGSNFTNTSMPQVITSNLNGQLYVIGTPNDVFTGQSSARAIAPRSSIIETTDNRFIKEIKKVKKDERRRATHNEVERRRRDKINNWITKLAKLIPENSAADMKGNGHYDGQSKGSILAKACEYIVELRDNDQKLELALKENKQLLQSVEHLKQRNAMLDRENKEYKELLKRNGVELAKDKAS